MTVKLGEDSLYPDNYDPSLLEPIPRQFSRAQLKVQCGELAFKGLDEWTAYELSWLSGSGKPCVAVAKFTFAADSDAIIESKSFKYYLNSFNQTIIESHDQLRAILVKDLSYASGGLVDVEMIDVNSDVQCCALPGVCLDDIDITITTYQPDASLIEYNKTQKVIEESYYSHLLKSNCPVTGQPDWATLWIRYSGSRIEPESFLRYVISFRQHQDFHENCVEKIFMDLYGSAELDSLEVYARYTRRGGLDINPYRASHKVRNERFSELASIRVMRQ
ncbi:7-cyano-7-deazaguanine reductase [Alteromonadaceae bacterium Bs31]|nr:7-cyano-7-deazaguanine reductase [Alteromonadaceae bacterium Bs31]